MVWLPVLVSVAMVAAAVGAEQQRRGQRGPGQRGGFGGLGMTLAQVASNENVQKEIALRPDQREKLRGAMAELRPQGMGREAMQDLSAEARQELRAKREAAAKQLEAKLAETLTAEQMKRVKEIWMQALGASGAVQQPEVAEALGITEQQQQQISEARREMFQSLRSGEGERPNMAALRAKMNEKIEGLLSGEQRAEWKKMCGKPFDVSTLLRQRQGRGRRSDN
jgi:hypothetical protein